MKVEDIVNVIVNKMGTWNDLTAYERVLIQYVVETTLGLVKK
jgi:hypothetical protein